MYFMQIINLSRVPVSTQSRRDDEDVVTVVALSFDVTDVVQVHEMGSFSRCSLQSVAKHFEMFCATHFEMFCVANKYLGLEFQSKCT